MILVITHKQDFTADFLINKLNQRKIPYKRFNCEDLLSYEYTFQFNKNFVYSILGVNKFHSVWFRRIKLPEIENLLEADRRYILQESDSFLSNLFASINATWVSDPFYVDRAENKFLQLQEAQRVGLVIPPTLITSSRKYVLNFYDAYKGNVIVKPISNTRVGSPDNPRFIFTSVLTRDIVSNIDHYELTPCIFQEQIKKEYELRVTVVGEKVFAAAVDSQQDDETQIDWRRKRLKFRAVTIPDELTSKCVRLVKNLNLQFGAIDLIKTPDGGYYFLEINPNGQWVWIETDTGLEISEALITILTA